MSPDIVLLSGYWGRGQGAGGRSRAGGRDGGRDAGREAPLSHEAPQRRLTSGNMSLILLP